MSEGVWRVFYNLRTRFFVLMIVDETFAMSDTTHPWTPCIMRWVSITFVRSSIHVRRAVPLE